MISCASSRNLLWAIGSDHSCCSTNRASSNDFSNSYKTESANEIGFGSEGAGSGVTKASEHQHPVCAEDCAGQVFGAEKY
jgi:hypothetical protein